MFNPRKLNTQSTPKLNTQEKPKEYWETAPTVLEDDGKGDKGAWKLSQVKLRTWLADPQKAILCPGVYDGITARLALAQGFECLFLPNAPISLARSGIVAPEGSSPDYALEVAQTIRQIDKVVPLIVEMDKSLDAAGIKAAMTPFHHAGIAAILLEDEFSFGYPEKQNFASIPPLEDAFLGRVQAAADERFRLQSDIVIISKTNLIRFWDTDKMFDRATRLLREAVKMGAVVVFIAGHLKLSSVEKLARESFKDNGVMTLTYGTTVKNLVSNGAKMISYPDFFTYGLFNGVASPLQDFREFGEMKPSKLVPKPHTAEDLGGLRGLMVRQQPK